jgi:hypothetical protein
MQAPPSQQAQQQALTQQQQQQQQQPQQVQQNVLHPGAPGPVSGAPAQIQPSALPVNLTRDQVQAMVQVRLLFCAHMLICRNGR